MASLHLSNVQGRKRKMVLLPGNVVFGGTGAVSSTSSDGAWTLTRTGTGAYTLTFVDDWYEIVGLWFTPLCNTADSDESWQIVTQTSTGFTIEHCTDTTLADPASGDRVYIMAVVNDSSVGP